MSSRVSELGYDRLLHALGHRQCIFAYSYGHGATMSCPKSDCQMRKEE